MVEIKEMPCIEKYERVLRSLEHDEYVLGFVEEHLGQEAADEYRERRAAVMRPVPDDVVDEAKYQIAYENLMAGAGVAFDFVRERMGDQGIEQMAEAGARELIRENAGRHLLLLRLIRAVSPGTAFKMVGKRSAYELQWLTPYTVEELSRKKVVFNVPDCKILDYPDTEDVCRVGCQREYPLWMAEQLRVNMDPDRNGKSCTITVTPLR
jgi:hypothetical protein